MKQIIQKMLAGSRLPDPADATRGSLDESGEEDDIGRWGADLPPELRPDTDTLRPAAVLVPLVERESGLTVLLTRRTDSLPEHPGQIAFPGGRHEELDSDLLATALRETHEEIGLAPQFIELAGFLPPYLTITRYSVTPVVGFVQPGFELRPDPVEVADIFEVPLEYLLDPANQRKESREFKGMEVSYYVIDYEFEGEEYRIWGATAAMLVDFTERLRMAVKETA